MANPHKGETSLKIGDVTYTLRLSYNALCDMETELGVKTTAVLASAFEGSWKDTRALLYAALHGAHPETTLEGAGDLIEEYGIAKIMDVLTELAGVTFRPSKDDEPENPPKQQ
jgi:hypothetical protein